MDRAMLDTNLDALRLAKKGKVRDVYEIDNNLLIVATDRISAFDVIMPNGIPDKGKILTELSNFWFEHTKGLIDNHLLSSDFAAISGREKQLSDYAKQLDGRSVLVKKTKPLPVECVVRGYLAGSGWKEYKKSKSVCGISLGDGLVESSKLPEPIFTPSTKAETGHDENIDEAKTKEIIGEETFNFLKDISIKIYTKCADYALSKGIIIADTKFEFGTIDGKIILIDEILTPDSSRFWPKDMYSSGKSQPSFDKQFVRDYLETLDWDKTPPGPTLPVRIVNKTKEKYYQALEMIKA